MMAIDLVSKALRNAFPVARIGTRLIGPPHRGADWRTIGVDVLVLVCETLVVIWLAALVAVGVHEAVAFRL
jgi:hypothetical protein